MAARVVTGGEGKRTPLARCEDATAAPGRMRAGGAGRRRPRTARAACGAATSGPAVTACDASALGGHSILGPSAGQPEGARYRRAAALGLRQARPATRLPFRSCPARAERRRPAAHKEGVRVAAAALATADSRLRFCGRAWLTGFAPAGSVRPRRTESAHSPTRPYTSAVAVYADLVRYRELFANLFRRDFQAKYRGSVLGIVWSLVNPLALMAVYLVVFGLLWQGERHPALPALPARRARLLDLLRDVARRPARGRSSTAPTW